MKILFFGGGCSGWYQTVPEDQGTEKGLLTYLQSRLLHHGTLASVILLKIKQWLSSNGTVKQAAHFE